MRKADSSYAERSYLRQISAQVSVKRVPAFKRKTSARMVAGASANKLAESKRKMNAARSRFLFLLVLPDDQERS